MAPRKKSRTTAKKKSARRIHRHKTAKPVAKNGLIGRLPILFPVKSGRRKKDKLKQRLFLLIAGIGILLLILMPVLLIKVSTQPHLLSVSPIAHLIASLSAQNKPILIDPEFSYQEEPQLKQEVPERIIIPSLKRQLLMVFGKLLPIAPLLAWVVPIQDKLVIP
jgi:hypothetical protein